MRIAPILVASLLVFTACSKKKDGLPPADDWSGGAMGDQTPQPQPQRGAAPQMGQAQPGDQMPPGHPDIGDQMPPGHPDLGGGGGDQMPPGHPDMGGGSSGGVDVTKLGLNAPDPNRKVDPAHHIAGTITVHEKAKARVKDGGAIFLIVKQADANGQPSGPPLAVDKVMYSPGLKFVLTDAQAMVAGTTLAGDVVVTARYDQDSDAISKQPGDVTGMARVKVPADGVAVVLDTVLP